MVPFVLVRGTSGANKTTGRSQAIVEYSLPWWLPLLGLGAIGVIVLIALGVLFGRKVLD